MGIKVLDPEAVRNSAAAIQSEQNVLKGSMDNIKAIVKEMGESSWKDDAQKAFEGKINDFDGQVKKLIETMEEYRKSMLTYVDENESIEARGAKGFS